MKKANPRLIKLVNLLNNHEFHSGDELGLTLGITRSAVWKHIQKLMDYNVEINSIKGKGYSLNSPLILLEEKKIKTLLNNETKKIIQLNILETVTSTNSYVRALPAKTPFTLCLAEHQSQGRGRFQRVWCAPFAQNIYFSCRYRFKKDMSELGGLSLVMGLAVIHTLHTFDLNNKVSIKWPNDIVSQACKLAGTLIEVNAETHGHCETIIGIGLNVNMLENTITQPWTSMRKLADKYFDRNAVVAALIENVIQYIYKFEQQGFSAFMNEWKDNDYLSGQSITLLHGMEEITGKALGINQQGHLLLKTSDGIVQNFSSGETSIKKN